MSDEYSNPPADAPSEYQPPQTGKLKWVEVWTKAVTKPQPETYVELVEQEPKHFQTALIWVGISSLITAILSTINQASANQFLDYFSEYTDIDPSFMPSELGVMGGILSIPVSLFFGIVASFIVAGIIHFIAKLLGGEGEFSHFYYAVATYQFPLSIAIGILGIIPFIGCLNIFISFYMLYLLVQTTRGIHKLDTGKAAIAALAVPIFLFFIFFCCAVVFFFIFINFIPESFIGLSSFILPLF